MAFHDLKNVQKITVQKRSNEIVNRLNRTKTELYPDLAAEREAYNREACTMPQLSNLTMPGLLIELTSALVQLSYCMADDQLQIQPVGSCDRVEKHANQSSRISQVRQGRKAETQARKKAEKAAHDEAKREAELRSYKHIMQDDVMMSRSAVAEKYSTPQDYEEDFM